VPELHAYEWARNLVVEGPVAVRGPVRQVGVAFDRLQYDLVAHRSGGGVRGRRHLRGRPRDVGQVALRLRRGVTDDEGPLHASLPVSRDGAPVRELALLIRAEDDAHARAALAHRRRVGAGEPFHEDVVLYVVPVDQGDLHHLTGPGGEGRVGGAVYRPTHADEGHAALQQSRRQGVA